MNRTHAPHEHAHGPPPTGDPHYRLLALAVEELLVENGVFTAEEHAAQIAAMDARTPARGARIVARAWTDPAYAARLLANAAAAAEELDIATDGTPLVALANTPRVHNLVVCTLCSCYPRALLGLPPQWYKSAAYRRRAIREPRAVLRAFGTELPPGVEVRVHDSTADMRYLVVPERPAGTEGWREPELARLVSRDSMIGAARARQPDSP